GRARRGWLEGLRLHRGPPGDVLVGCVLEPEGEDHALSADQDRAEKDQRPGEAAHAIAARPCRPEEEVQGNPEQPEPESGDHTGEHEPAGMLVIELELLGVVAGGPDASDDAGSDQESRSENRHDPGWPHPAALEVEDLLS